MRNMINKIKEKKIIALVISIIIVITILINSTYSLLVRTDHTDEQAYTTGILEISSNKVGDSVTLSNALPMEDDAGLTSDPYTFKIENTGNLNYIFDVKLLATSSENLIDSQYINISLDGENIISLSSLTNGTLFEDITLAPEEFKEFSLRVWLDSDTPNSQIGKVFNGKITTEGYAVYTEEAVEGYDYLMTMAENRNTDTPDFTKTSCSSGCEEATVGLYAYEDDLGTSYYFRGDVENNYVKFGKNASNQDMYWRIIRINGDGTVRMIYDGTQAWENGVSSVDNAVGNSVFNESPDYDFSAGIGYSNQAHVGYMYGQINVDDSSLWHVNTNNSAIKTFLEGEPNSNNTGWYYENVVVTGYHDYVADAIYCNDRSYSNYSYDAYERLVGNDTTDVVPKLICTNKNDRFTISTSKLAPTDGLGTNQKLKYPIGLITADEFVIAGGNRSAYNLNFYLYSADRYWTMTPEFNFQENIFVDAIVFSIGSKLSEYNASIAANDFKVRPVISLKPEALKYGTGVIGDEFRITK